MTPRSWSQRTLVSPAKKPQQFIDHRADVDLFGRQQREACGEIKVDLTTKETACADSGPIVTIDAV